MRGSPTADRPRGRKTKVTSVNAHSSQAQGGYQRELFTVEGVRVTFDGAHWQCACKGAWCTHIEHAQRFRQLRGSRPALEPIQLAFAGLEPPIALEGTSARRQLLRDRAALALTRPPEQRIVTGMATVLAATLFFVLAYFALEQPPAIATVAVASPRPPAIQLREMPEPPKSPPVKLTNPFDPSEIFEFPPGTSADDARESAANFLLERARQRLAVATERDRSM